MNLEATTGARVRVLLFLAAVVALGWWGFDALRRELAPGAGDLRFTAVFDSVGGLKAGAPVRLAGVTVGRVPDLHFIRRGDRDVVSVTVDIRAEHARLVRQGATVRIETLGVLGDRHIALGMAPSDSPPVKPGEVVEGEEPITSATTVRKLDAAVDDIRVVASFMRRIVETTEGVKNLWYQFKSRFTDD